MKTQQIKAYEPKLALRDYDAIQPLLAKVEQLAQEDEYNDHRASLQITQGLLAGKNGKTIDAINYYEHAMINALRYNRFCWMICWSGDHKLHHCSQSFFIAWSVVRTEGKCCSFCAIGG